MNLVNSIFVACNKQSNGNQHKHSIIGLHLNTIWGQSNQLIQYYDQHNTNVTLCSLQNSKSSKKTDRQLPKLQSNSRRSACKLSAVHLFIMNSGSVSE